MSAGTEHLAILDTLLALGSKQPAADQAPGLELLADTGCDR
ncbi:MAG: hypothetical protein WBN31_13770 [Gammaproteobacteria bacterium]